MRGRTLRECQDDFTRHLEEHLKNPEWAKGYYEELENTKIALEIASLREKKRLTQAQLAERVGTVQSAIARLENPNYEKASLSILRKIANALDARLVIRLEPKKKVRAA